mmetsp:Transcript_19864/g.56478  ORF Transcript_19864/g.56478 Transcript_19864/m.56478 type:complete len:281 (-) Transcript_19864:160-1002(-)
MRSPRPTRTRGPRPARRCSSTASSRAFERTLPVGWTSTPTSAGRSPSIGSACRIGTAFPNFSESSASTAPPWRSAFARGIGAACFLGAGAAEPTTASTRCFSAPTWNAIGRSCPRSTRTALRRSPRSRMTRGGTFTTGWTTSSSTPFLTARWTSCISTRRTTTATSQIPSTDGGRSYGRGASSRATIIVWAGPREEKRGSASGRDRTSPRSSRPPASRPAASTRASSASFATPRTKNAGAKKRLASAGWRSPPARRSLGADLGSSSQARAASSAIQVGGP